MGGVTDTVIASTTSADEVTLTQSGGVLSVKDGGINTTQIADDAVDNDKLADDAVDTDQLAAEAVEQPNINQTFVRINTADNLVGYIWGNKTVGQGTWALNAMNREASIGAFTTTLNFGNGGTQANGDYITFPLYLEAGTYSLYVFLGNGTASAVVDFYIDASEVASFDGYTAGNAQAGDTQTGITVATSGVKTIKIIADGKSAGTGYYVGIWEFRLIRTGA